MKSTQKKLSYVLLTLALAFSSCAKDGEDGAIGPQGPQGEQGLAGMDGMDGQDATANDTESTADVYHPILDQILGSSTLIKSEGKVTAKFETSNLSPGYAYTLWWVVFNKPENCVNVPCGLPDLGNPDTKVDLLFASGKVADESGMAIFPGLLLEHDGSTSVNDVLGLPIDVGGLWDAQTAEIQLVLRSHGPAISGDVGNQISSYGGGCTVFFQPFEEIPDAIGECAETQVSVHLAISN